MYRLQSTPDRRVVSTETKSGVAMRGHFAAPGELPESGETGVPAAAPRVAVARRSGVCRSLSDSDLGLAQEPERVSGQAGHRHHRTGPLQSSVSLGAYQEAPISMRGVWGSASSLVRHGIRHHMREPNVEKGARVGRRQLAASEEVAGAAQLDGAQPQRCRPERVRGH